VTEPVVRFLRRVEVDPDFLCWLWTGPGRYFYVDETTTLTVRQFAFKYWRGRIPARHEVVPRCGVVRCVNPDHLTVADKATRDAMVASAVDDVRPRCRGYIIRASDRAARAARAEAPRGLRELDRCSIRCDAGHWMLGDNAATKTASNGEVSRRCKTCQSEQRQGALAIVPDLSGETHHDRFVADRLARLLGVAS
jgi:hypothetical protein